MNIKPVPDLSFSKIKFGYKCYDFANKQDFFLSNCVQFAETNHLTLLPCGLN